MRKEIEFEYEIIYDNGILMATYINLEKAIKEIKTAIKNNPHSKGRFTIELDGNIIARY